MEEANGDGEREKNYCALRTRDWPQSTVRREEGALRLGGDVSGHTGWELRELQCNNWEKKYTGI